MSKQFPLVINFEGDYGMKVLLVDDQATIAEVATIAKNALVGTLLKPLPEDANLVVRRHQDESHLDNSTKVADAGFIEMEALDITHTG